MTDPDYEQAVADISRPLAAVYSHSEHTRFLTRLVMVGLALVVCFVAVNIYFDVRINQAGRSLARQNETIYATCVARNDSRAKLVQVFTYLLNNRTASSTNQSNIASIAYVQSQFPQTDCGPKPR